MKAIINTNIVMSDHMIADGAIVMDGDKIVDIGKNIKVLPKTIIDKLSYGKMVKIDKKVYFCLV